MHGLGIAVGLLIIGGWRVLRRSFFRRASPVSVAPVISALALSLFLGPLVRAAVGLEVSHLPAKEARDVVSASGLLVIFIIVVIIFIIVILSSIVVVFPTPLLIIEFLVGRVVLGSGTLVPLILFILFLRWSGGGGGGVEDLGFIDVRVFERTVNFNY